MSNYIIKLPKINTLEIEQKYGITLSSNLEKRSLQSIPKNTTKISSLDTKNICFFDETKKLKKCHVSFIDFSTKRNIKNLNYNCFWDKNPIKNDNQIGCPIQYVNSRLNKTYFSEISRDTYSIGQDITKNRLTFLKQDKIDYPLEELDYYVSDGVFCSFNCCLSWIHENRYNPLYDYSETLLFNIHNKLYKNININPAPHWRNLIEYGGTLTIKKFRETLSKIEFKFHGLHLPKYNSIGYLHEEKITF